MRYVTRRSVITFGAILFGIAVLLIAAYSTFRVGYSLQRVNLLSKLTFDRTLFDNAPFGRLPRHRQLLLLYRDAGPVHLSQDRWVVQVLFPDLENGYYVDVGSADGISGPNTKVLDDLGWNGEILSIVVAQEF